MKTILAAIVVLSTVGSAAAQTAITITPRGNDLTIDNGYVGPYGAELPGVALFRGRAIAVTPDAWDGGLKTPSYAQIENEQSYSQSELPILDSYHGTLSDGFPF